MTATERNWLRAGAIFLLSLAAFGAIYAVEMDLGRWNRDIRLVRDPAQASMHFLGISHFLVAALYMTTSKRMRTLASWSRLGLLLGLGGLLCLGYARLSAASALAGGFAFVAYFLVHDVRDQVFFYFSNGDAPRTDDTAAMATVLTWSPFLLAAAAAAVAIPFAILAFPGAGALRAAYSSQPPWLPWLLMIAPAALVAAGFLRLMGPWRRGGLGTIASVARSNVPIWLVLGGTAANLGLGSLTGWGAHGIVIMHVVTWYVFILAQFARRGAATKPSHWTWRWLRDTPTGFKTLHVGSVAVLVAAGAVWAYGFRNTPDLTAFRLLLDGDLFRYWTIMHVTVSFGSR